jgi:hypothetical protein
MRPPLGVACSGWLFAAEAVAIGVEPVLVVSDHLHRAVHVQRAVPGATGAVVVGRVRVEALATVVRVASRVRRLGDDQNDPFAIDKIVPAG